MFWLFCIIALIIGFLAYTLDISFGLAIGLFILLAGLCVWIGSIIDGQIKKKQPNASQFIKNLRVVAIVLIILGAIFMIIAYNAVSNSEEIYMTRGGMLNSTVTPSVAGMIGVFLVLLGLSCHIVSKEK